MAQVTLSEKGIGPFEYKGFNYWVAPASTRVLRQWKTSNTDTVGASSRTDGIANTNSMNNADHPAAQYVRNLGSEWYLPAIEELDNVVYQNREEIDAADTTIGGSTSPSLANITVFVARDDRSRGWGWVWSSTEYSSLYARAQRLFDGDINGYYKNIEHWVVGVHKEPIA